MTKEQRLGLAEDTAIKRLQFFHLLVGRDVTPERLQAAIRATMPSEEMFALAAFGTAEQMARTAGGYACAQIMHDLTVEGMRRRRS